MEINTYTNIFIVVECHAKAVYMLWTLSEHRAEWSKENDNSSRQGEILSKYPFTTNQNKLYNELIYSLLIALFGVVILITNLLKIKNSESWRR